MTTSTRRTFLQQAAAGALVLSIAQTADAKSPKRSSHSASQRILILGGTGYLGSHYVPAALAQGHRVSALVLKDDPAQAALPVDVERLVGDRNGDLTSIQNRDWDAVIDLATYVPAWVRSLGEALRGRVRHYTLISTVNVYAPPGEGRAIDESSSLLEYHGEADPYTLKVPGQFYGELKVLCEREAERQFPGNALILRPSYIVGPGDKVAALTYLAARMQKGGEILAAGDPLSSLHAIDVRDKAKWVIEMIGRGETGIFNAVGPPEAATWGELLKTLTPLAAAPVKPTWVPVSWLARHKVTDPTDPLLFWTCGGSTGSSGVGSDGPRHILNAKARAHGLMMRPLIESARDALAHYRTLSAEQQASLMMFSATQGLDGALSREKQLLADWHVDAGV